LIYRNNKKSNWNSKLSYEIDNEGRHTNSEHNYEQNYQT
jgi:hypothetical protein